MIWHTALKSKMDWTLIGALAGVGILAAVVGYGSFALIHSGSDPAAQSSASAALLPAREGPPLPVPNAEPVPATAESSSAMLTPPLPPAEAPAKSFAVASVESPAPRRRRKPAVPEPVGSQARDNVPILYDEDAPPTHRPADLAARNSPVVAHGGAGPRPEPHLPTPNAVRPQSEFEWRVVTTAKASFFNLGGHVDKDGVVDSLASSYLRKALRKQKNYLSLPPSIRAYIEAPTINLARIAGYRSVLGVDDRKMELEQGVRFIKIASTRGIDLANPAGDLDAIDAGYGVSSSFDMNALNKMYFDIASTAMLGFIP